MTPSSCSAASRSASPPMAASSGSRPTARRASCPVPHSHTAPVPDSALPPSPPAGTLSARGRQVPYLEPAQHESLFGPELGWPELGWPEYQMRRRMQGVLRPRRRRQWSPRDSHPSRPLASMRDGCSCAARWRLIRSKATKPIFVL
eukprot:scaffold28670_cov66-Phaeocystis_antarctica.AAC.3